MEGAGTGKGEEGRKENNPSVEFLHILLEARKVTKDFQIDRSEL